MDAVMADVTDVPGPAVGVDDEFVLIGEQGGERITALDVARARTTISWEVVTGMSRRLPRVYHAGLVPLGVQDARGVEVSVARIQLWNGDICDLEVDAIVNPANPSLWMATGVGGAIKRAGGDAIEFDAVRQGPIGLGEAVVTPAGRLAARLVIHAVSLDRDRRTGAAVDRERRPRRHGPGPRERRDDDRLPGTGHGRRRLPARRGGPDHPGRGP